MITELLTLREISGLARKTFVRGLGEGNVPFVISWPVCLSGGHHRPAHKSATCLQATVGSSAAKHTNSHALLQSNNDMAEDLSDQQQENGWQPAVRAALICRILALG